MARRFRVGLVGPGGVVRQFHLPGWKSIPGAEIAGVADVNLAAEAEAEAAAAPGGPLPRILSVLCEKPICVTSAEVRALGELADRRSPGLFGKGPEPDPDPIPVRMNAKMRLSPSNRKSRDTSVRVSRHRRSNRRTGLPRPE